MKFISWNVNGFRACLNKGFGDFFENESADFFCIQETKMQPDQADFAPLGYEKYFNSAEKKGYSGTAIFSKHKPISVTYGINGEHIDEGRVITLEMEEFYLVNAYVPNAQPELKRLDYRMKFEDDLREYLISLDKKKPIIYCGDLNVAHEEIDLKHPKANIGNPGFSYEERGKFSKLLNSGFTDSFRKMHPDLKDAYSWWSYRFNARVNNAGWRIDYFVISDRIFERVSEAKIYPEIFGSDHCPVGLTIDI